MTHQTQQNRQPQAAVGIDAKTASRSPLGIDCFPDLETKTQRDRAGGEDRVDERQFVSYPRALGMARARWLSNWAVQQIIRETR